MSIHLDPFKPKATDRGVVFFADVNGKRFTCIISAAALGVSKQLQLHEQVELFKKRWPEFRDNIYSRIQRGNFLPDTAIVFQANDFAIR